ncbi:MAG: response regulator [Chloroflexi bacterium]|nr:response regulator [Chloroflexota bacterium]
MATSGKQSLVIEADPVLRDLMKLGLERAGFAVQTSGTAQEAQSLITPSSPDLILIDMTLPGEAELAFISGLKRSENPHPAPVIVISALGYREVIAQAIQAGAGDFFVKPFHIDELIRRVQRWLR